MPYIGVVESRCSSALTINENHRHILVTLSHTRAVSSLNEVSTQSTNAMKWRSTLPIYIQKSLLLLLLALYLRSCSIIKSIIFRNLLLIDHACLLTVQISVNSLECSTHITRDPLYIWSWNLLWILRLLSLISEVPYSIVEVGLNGFELRVEALGWLRTARVDQLQVLVDELRVGRTSLEHLVQLHDLLLLLDLVHVGLRLGVALPALVFTRLLQIRALGGQLDVVEELLQVAGDLGMC